MPFWNNYGYQGVEPGLESVKAFYRNAIWAAFPDAAVNIEDVLEEGAPSWRAGSL